MNESLHDEMIRLSLKGELTADERARVNAFLAAHPHLRETWEEDAALGRALNLVPEVPVSSNFTARVLDAIDLDEQRAARKKPNRWRAWLRDLQPRVSWGFAVAVVLLFGAYEYHLRQETHRLALDVRNVSREIASLPSPDVFKDFEAINELRQVSAVASAPSASDDELIRVLQQ